MNGIKQFVGRRVLVSTIDGGAVAGVLVRARRSGVELKGARDMLHGNDLAGAVFVPTRAVVQVQMVTEGA